MSADHGRLTTAPSDHRRLPRRRDRALIDAIHAATLAELADTGYMGLSIERVAKRARTSKAAIYRRWPARATKEIGHVRSPVRCWCGSNGPLHFYSPRSSGCFVYSGGMDTTLGLGSNAA